MFNSIQSDWQSSQIDQNDQTTSIAKKQTDQNDPQSQVTETIIMRTKWLRESDQIA